MIYISSGGVEETGIGKGLLVVVNETVFANGLLRLGNELEIEDVYFAEEKGTDRLKWSAWYLMIVTLFLAIQASQSSPETAVA